MPFKRLLFVMCVVWGLSCGLVYAAEAAVTPDTSDMFRRVVDQLSFEGLHQLSETQVLERTSLFTKFGARSSQRLLDQDQLALQATGWFKTVHARVEPSRYGLRAIYQLEENPVVSNIVLSRSDVLNKQALSNLLVQKTGEALNLADVQVSIQHINQAYQAASYPLCEVSTVHFDEASGVLSIVMREPVIERIEVAGNVQVKDSIILREMETKVGDVFNVAKLRKDRTRVVRLGYFSAVSNPELLPSDRPDHLAVCFHVTEQKTNVVRLGLEQDGAALVFFTDTSLANLLGTGESFSFKVLLGGLQSYRVRYYNPWLFNTYHVGFALMRFYDITTETFQTHSTGVLRNGWETVLDIPYSDEFKLTVGYRAADTSEINTSAGLSPYQTRSVKFGAAYDDVTLKNNLERGTSGFLTFEQGGNLGLVNLGGINYLRSEGKVSHFWSWGDATVIGANANMGLYLPVQGSAIVETEYFEVGGGTTLRGIVDTNPMQGPRKMLGNVEIRHLLWDKLQGVLFYDAGKAFSDTYDFNNFQIGYGAGLRFVTPIGPLRVDSGWGRDGNVIHFGLGSVF